jgi:hypothetical protein
MTSLFCFFFLFFFKKKFVSHNYYSHALSILSSYLIFTYFTIKTYIFDAPLIFQVSITYRQVPISIVLSFILVNHSS